MFKLKGKLIVAVMVMFGITAFMSCKKETHKEKNYTNEDIELVGQRHNDGIDYILGEFEKSEIASVYNKKKSTNEELTDEEKLVILKFLDVKSKEFILNNPLTYNGNVINIENYIFTNEQLLSFCNTIYDNEIVSELQLKYFNLLETAYYNKSNETLELAKEIDKIVAEATVEISVENELVPVLVMSSVLKYSESYWHSGLKSSQKWFAIALADAINGGEGALWGGAVAGPLGAVVIGVNGALIGSCSAYLLGEI